MHGNDTEPAALAGDHSCVTAHVFNPRCRHRDSGLEDAGSEERSHE
jgi:hypothetical protein